MENEKNKENQQKTEDMAEFFPYKECEQYIGLLQDNISRMANNSANCKNWLIAILVGAFAVTGKDAFLTIAPFMYWVIGLFYFLDCFYLGQERKMIRAERKFVASCRGEVGDDEIKGLLFSFSSHFKKNNDKEEKNVKKCVIKCITDFFEQSEPTKCDCLNTILHYVFQLKDTIGALFSWSTTPFYVVLFVALNHIVKALGYNCSCCCCM